jgi:hypothetical protein
MGSDRFATILAASPKAFREDLFRRAGVRVKGNAFSLSSAPKNQVRAEKLHEAIKNGLDLGDDVLEELIRNYLYTRRPMLADALNHFSVKNDNGLTEEDLSFIDNLPPEKGQELRALLEAKYDKEDVELYLAFMNIKS